MRITNALGLAVFAVLVATASIGPSSALAKDRIVVCKLLVKKGALCPSGEIFPQGTIEHTLCRECTLITSISSVQCEDAVAEIELLASAGFILPVDIKNLAVGMLPKPTLGEGCTGCEKVHFEPQYTGIFEVTGEDVWWLTTKLTGVTLKGCTFGAECSYGGENLKFKIDPDATVHPNLPNSPGDLILVENELKKTGGSFVCPATSKLTGSFTIYGCLSGGALVDCYIALYKETG